MLRRAGFIGIILALFCAGTLPVAWGANGRYQQGKLRRLKACVGIIPTLGEPVPPVPPANPFAPGVPDPDAISRQRSPNANPYLFYVLDQRKDLKPDGWEFYNPAAAPFPTAAQVTRWNSAAAPWPPSAPGLTTSTPLKSDMAAYWELAISQANYDRLAQMDVIYIPIARNDGSNPVPTFFTEEQRRVLARLADSGVTIWVDWALDTPTVSGALGGNENPGSPLTRTKNAFFTNADFAQAAGTAGAAAGHPLLTQPFNLSAEYTRLGKAQGAMGATPPSTNRVVETRALDMQPTMNLAAVVPTSAGPATDRAYIAAGRYGAGYVVITAGNTGAAVSGPALSGAAGNAVTRVTNQDLGLAEAEDLKFAYNIFQWATEVTKTQKNSRHTGQSSVAVDGLIEQGNYPHLVQVGPTYQTYPPAGVGALPVNPAAPLIINGVVVAAVRTLSGGGVQSELAAFELNPNDDFNGNGYIDEPLTAADPASHPFADYSIGQNYDRIDAYNVGAGTYLYGMTAGELYSTGTLGAAAYVFAAGNTGIISVPVPIAGVPMNWSSGGAQVTPAATLGMAISGSPAFTLVPGSTPATTQAKLFVGGIQQPTGFGGNNGRVMGLLVNSAGAMAPEWYFPPRAEANQLGPVAGSLTTAQVMDTGTGAVDTMLFATTVSPNLTAGGAGAGRQGEASGAAMGWILASRGDPLAFATGNAAAGANNVAGGRRFTSARWINIPPGRGVRAPDPREITWDVTKYYEVRVMDKARNYVLARFVPGTPGFNVLTNGTAGQVELPEPTGPLSVFSLDPTGMDARLRNMWNLNDFVLLADYSLLPTPVDTGLTGEATMRPRFTPPTPYLRPNANTVEPTGVAGGVSVGKDNLVYYGTGKGYMCAVEWKQGRPIFRWKVHALPKDRGNGLSQDIDPTSATYLSDYGFVAPPSAGNRVVFSSRTGTAYVFEPDATIRFKLTNVLNPGLVIPWTPGLAEEVVLRGDHGAGVTPNSQGIMSHTSPFGRAPEQFLVDPDTGTATFQNMENFALDLSQALSPAQAQATYGVNTGGRPAVPIQWWFRNAPPGMPTVTSPATALIPLPLVSLYNATAPVDTFYAGAIQTADKIYLMGGSGWLHELPVDPKALNPNFPFPTNGLTGFDLANGLRRVKNVAVGAGLSMAAPAITQGMLVTNTPRGLTLYGSPSVVIADSNRVVEASGNSTALASTDVVIKHRMDISEFAIPSDPSLANTVVAGVPRAILTERLPISRAAVVKKLDRASSLTGLFNSSTITDAPIDGTAGIKELPDWAESSYLVADPGNNRVVEFNPAGKTVWDCNQIYDPMDYIPAGEPLKLSGPMDVQRWVEREIVPGLPQPVYVIHTLIADTGNNRVVEIVDKVQYQNGYYGPDSFVAIPGQVGSNGQPFRWYHVVVWSSQTGTQGMRLRYRTAQRVYWPDRNGNRIPLGAVTGAPAVPAGQAVPAPPYLPVERAVTYVMATVQGQQVTYPTPTGYTADYFRTHAATNRGVIERRPNVVSGPDSIVFLRDKFRFDDASGQLQYVPNLREPFPMGTPTAADQYRFAQGVVDPNLPIISVIGHESGTIPPPPAQPYAHQLNGVASVQLTVRADIKFAPLPGGGPMQRLPYLLIADTDGVWETCLVAGPPNNRMVWAFTADDYAYVTGAGNGNPALVYSNSGADQRPGGRRLNAVSARRLPSGLVLVTSRIPVNEQPRGNPAGGEFTHQNIGADVFILRPSDFHTLVERGGAPWVRTAIDTHGWQPDQWVQTTYTANIPPALRGAPSIRWRAAEQLNPSAPPTLRTQLEPGGNPAELTGSYIPAQPNYADIAY